MNIKMDPRLSEGAVDFIDDHYLENLLVPKTVDPGRVRAIISKSMSKEPLCQEETAVLLQVEDPGLIEEIISSQVMERTEAVNKLHFNGTIGYQKSTMVAVTYPEALTESVISPTSISKQQIQIKKGEKNYFAG